MKNLIYNIFLFFLIFTFCSCKEEEIKDNFFPPIYAPDIFPDKDTIVSSKRHEFSIEIRKDFDIDGIKFRLGKEYSFFLLQDREYYAEEHDGCFVGHNGNFPDLTYYFKNEYIYSIIDYTDNIIQTDWIVAKINKKENRFDISIDENPNLIPRIFFFRIIYLDRIVADFWIYQEAAVDSEPFEMKARYKGKIYETMAYIDKEGKLIMENEEFNLLMNKLDNMDDVETIIMDDKIVDYFDKEDFENNNRLYNFRQQVENIENPIIRDDIFHTRADATRFMDDKALGYCAVFDDTGFSDTNLYMNFYNFNEFWDINYLKDYGLNDKISSLVVAYRGNDSSVCAVLTVWEDSHYNTNDKDRSKHRLSIIANTTNIYVGKSNLKDVKCLNSSSTWNDRISSFSFHFGNNGFNLKDY